LALRGAVFLMAIRDEYLRTYRAFNLSFYRQRRRFPRCAWRAERAAISGAQDRLTALATRSSALAEALSFFLLQRPRLPLDQIIQLIERVRIGISRDMLAHTPPSCFPAVTRAMPATLSALSRPPRKRLSCIWLACGAHVINDVPGILTGALTDSNKQLWVYAQCQPRSFAIAAPFLTTGAHPSAQIFIC